MKIRKAYPHDIPLIREIAFKTWPVTYEKLLTKEALDYMLELFYSEESLMKQMESGDEFVMLYDGVQPIGFAAVGMTEPGVFKLQKIYILPLAQGKGAGRLLLDEVVKAIKRKGGNSLLLNVKRDNDKARVFYEKYGFTIIKEVDIDIGNGFFMRDYTMEKKI